MASTTLRRRKGNGHHRMLASLRHDPSSPRRHLDWVLLVAVALITAFTIAVAPIARFAGLVATL